MTTQESFFVCVYVCTDRVNIIMTCNERNLSSNQDQAVFYRQQGILVTVRKDLCKLIQLGSDMTVVGVPTYHMLSKTNKLFIERTLEVIIKS